jgi:SAM-dependent methyltransferase
MEKGTGMKASFTPVDRRRIEKVIREKYAKAARSLEGLFRYPTGRAGLEGLGYEPNLMNQLPEHVLASYCGVGNPFSLGPLHPGETVLDIGCGGGVDTFVAAFLVGPTGQAVGIDATPEMLERANRNQLAVPLAQVAFLPAAAEDLPFRDQSFHVAMSNGVFNLIPDKASALTEVLRVLKPEGRFMTADQILTGELPEDSAARVASWAR